MFGKSLLDNEAVWLLGIYVKLVWDKVICKKGFVNQEKIESECSLQYYNHHVCNKPPLAHIVGLMH